MFEKILVPLDGSSFAEKALTPAMALAQQGHGEIILLSVPYTKQIVVEEWEDYGFDLSLAQSQQELADYLEGLKAKKAQPDLTLRTVVEVGDEASVIVDTAVAEEVDLIVMATHGRSGLSRWILGSITERVLRTAHCPVLVIRDDKPMAHIMITLDGSLLAEYALGPGMEIASRLDSRVTLLSVEMANMKDRTFRSEQEKAHTDLGKPFYEEFYHRAELYLQRLLRELQADLAQIVRIVPKTGPVAEAILETVATDDIDLIVMATHGHTGLKRWVYGSVTEKVLRAAPCNMFIMRPPLSALKPQTIGSELPEQQESKEAVSHPLVTNQPAGSALPPDPQSVMEKALLTDYLQQKGYCLADLDMLPMAKSRALMVAASQYASLKMAQVESTAHLREKLHRPF